jgi:hypothetical protein
MNPHAKTKLKVVVNSIENAILHIQKDTDSHQFSLYATQPFNEFKFLHLLFNLPERGNIKAIAKKTQSREISANLWELAIELWDIPEPDREVLMNTRGI